MIKESSIFESSNHRGWLRRSSYRVWLPLISVWLVTVAAHGQTWNPGTADWNTGTNWSPTGVPTGTATAIFGVSSQTAISFSANTTIGALQFNSTASAYTFNLGAFSLTIAGTGGITNSSSFDPTFTGTGGSLIKTGTGTLILSGNNTYTGTTTISAGTLQIGNGGAAGSIAGNVLDNADLVFNRSGAVPFAGNISGTGTFEQAGPGTVTLSGTNTYSGATTISAGKLQAGSNAALSPNSAFTVNGVGILDLNGKSIHVGSLAGSGTVTSSGLAQFSTGGDNSSTVFSGTITGSLSLTKIGTGTMTLTGNNTWGLGGTTVNAGVLSISTNANLGATNTGITLGGGELLTTGLTFSTARNVTLNSPSTLAAANGTQATYAGLIKVISGTGPLTIGDGVNSGIVIFAHLNTYTGGTTVLTGATLSVNADTELGNTTGGITLKGGELLTTANGFSTARLIDVMANGGLNTLAATTGTIATYSGVLSDTGALVVGDSSNAGTVVLTGNNTYSGGTTVAGGVLSVSSDSNLGGVAGITLAGGELLTTANGFSTARLIDVKANGGLNTLAATTGTTATYSGVLSDTGALVVGNSSNAGTVVLTGNNTYSGGTTIVGGTLQIGNGGTSGSIVGNVIDDGNLAFNRSDAVLIFSGNVSGTGSFSHIGTGTTTLNGNNTYSGVTSVSAGTLRAGSTTAFSPNSAFTVNSILDLNGFSNTVGSLAGNGTVTDKGGTPATLSAGGNGTNTVFSGTLINGTASLGLIKTGLGTLTLTGANTYTGGTTIIGGTLQIGNGGTTGSIVGNVLDNGSLVFNRSDAITFSGLVSGTGSLTQNGSGSLTLTAANTYSGGTVIDHGALLVDNAQALGTGNVTVNEGILAADPQPINVKGNYTQNPGGTLQLNVAGGNPGQYDTLNVGGNAALGGTLKLISLGFQPKAGDTLTLVSTGGSVSGRFAQFIDPFATGPGFTFADLVYEPDAVLLEFRNAASFALTPNQLAAARLIDAVHQDPRATNLISFLSAQAFANLPGDFEKISPDGLTALYEISFSNANIQKLNLESRLDDLHNGANGFSSNMKINGATVNPEDRANGDGKSSKAVVEPILQHAPENRWGVWVTGFGDFVDVDGDGNASGYNFTTGGVSLGLDYRITDQLAIGVMGEYSHTWTSLNPGGHIDVDSGRGGV